MHTVDSNCTPALRIPPLLFHFAIQSGSLSWPPVNGSLFCRKHKEPRSPWRSAAWTPRENLFLVAAYFLRLSALVFVIAACARLERAEGCSAKLVNHFLFSLRTAVDWPERPLCAPSRPASQQTRRFAPSAVCLHRGRRRGGKNDSHHPDASALARPLTARRRGV